jgi:hypothetical protein
MSSILCFYTVSDGESLKSLPSFFPLSFCEFAGFPARLIGKNRRRNIANNFIGNRVKETCEVNTLSKVLSGIPCLRQEAIQPILDEKFI